LDVQSNRLTKIENLEALVDTLEELYLAHNGIDVEGALCESGLALPFTQLNTVDMSRNRLTDTSPFAHLTSLTDLWISGNDIATYEQVEHLRGLTALDVVYLEYNPVASEFEYRMKLAQIVPSLTQIDANMIGGAGYATSGDVRTGDNLVERMRLMQEEALQKAQLTEDRLREADARRNEEPADAGKAGAEANVKQADAAAMEQEMASVALEPQDTAKAEDSD
jgi:protein phosphatase 1 regulatory subunit 7